MTVVARRVVASPVRTATETWAVIIDILAPRDGAARKELAGIGGVVYWRRRQLRRYRKISSNFVPLLDVEEFYT